jgi:hypothetical protein
MVVSAEIALPSPASAVISPSRAARSTAPRHAVVCMTRLAPGPRRVVMANGRFRYRLTGIRDAGCSDPDRSAPGGVPPEARCTGRGVPRPVPSTPRRVLNNAARRER